MNVIVVDWGHGATLPYDQATANTRVVGAQIAQLIQTIMNVTRAPASSFHIVGHSLGAHVAGYAGERVPHLGRITGSSRSLRQTDLGRSNVCSSLSETEKQNMGHNEFSNHVSY